VKWLVFVVLIGVLLLLEGAGAALAQRNELEPQPGYAMSSDTGRVEQVAGVKRAESTEKGKLAGQSFALPMWLLLIIAPYVLVALGLAFALRPSARY